MEINIGVLRTAAIKYGLEVNEEKSKVIKIRGKENVKKKSKLRGSERSKVSRSKNRRIRKKHLWI